MSFPLRLLGGRAFCTLAALLAAGSFHRASAQTGPPVTAHQVFMACRHPEAIRQNPVGDAPTRLNHFCRRGLPARDQWLVTDSVDAWLTAIPSRKEIRDYAVESSQFTAESFAKLTNTATLVGNDEVFGGITFGAGDTQLDATEVIFAEALGNRLGEEIRQGRAIGVRVLGYPDAPGASGSALGRNRALAVRAILLMDTVLSNREQALIASQADRAGAARDTFVQARSWTSGDAVRHPMLVGGVTVHLLFSPQAAPALTSLGEIRFALGSDQLDQEDFAVLTQTAREIVAANLAANVPIVITGFADAAVGDATTNLQLAQKRAEAIRNALALILRDHGITAQQIIAQAGLITSSAQSVEDARSAVISMGGLPAPAGSELTSTSSGASPAIPLSIEGVATAAAQVLADRAERQVQAYVYELVAAQVCTKYDALLRQTCLIVRDTTDGGARYQLSFANLRELVQRDFETVPTALLTRAVNQRLAAEIASLQLLSSDGVPDVTDAAVRQNFGQSVRQIQGWPTATASATFTALYKTQRNWAALERVRKSAGWAVVALYGVEFARRVRDGDDPLATLAGFDPWLKTQVAERPFLGFVDSSMVVVRVREFGTLMSRADSAAGTLRQVGGHALRPDTLTLYALRTALVNLEAKDQQPARQFLARSASYLIQARRHTEDLRVRLDSLRTEMRNLTGGGENIAEARRQLFALAMGEVAGRFSVLLADTALAIPGMRDSLAAFATPVRNLLYALQVRDLRSAFAETMVLIPRVLPGGVAIQGCTAGVAEGCARLGISGQWLRVAALATDVSQAQTNEDVRGAMERFLEQSTDIATKRTGPPVRRVFVNAYGAATGEPGYFGFQLPVGIELVKRDTVNEPRATTSLYFRAIELSGFLPREGQDGGRSTEEVIASLVRPGFYYLWAPGPRRGLPHIPRELTLGVGITSWAQPKDTTSAESEWEWKAKFSAFIGWDLPIFP